MARAKREEEERRAAEEHARHLAGLENVKRAKEILAKREKAQKEAHLAEVRRREKGRREAEEFEL